MKSPQESAKTSPASPKQAKSIEKTAKKAVKVVKTAQLATSAKPVKTLPPVMTVLPVTVHSEFKPKTPVPAKVKPAATVPASANKALTAAEVEELREKLVDLRNRMRGEVGTMTSAALTEKDEGQSSVPLHLADVGSDNYEQEQTLSFIESGSNTLQLIESALMRIKNGTYGTCENCGCNIPKPRLNFIPFTATCVKCVDV
ncbi:DNA-binding protein [Planctomycetales bacterium]|nr:DNA-binding protein [Planctomycetales bacterium]